MTGLFELIRRGRVDQVVVAVRLQKIAQTPLPRVADVLDLMTAAVGRKLEC